MKAVVLAGGLRSGLEIPGSALPRALWPFPRDPMITLALRFLARSGVREIAICANGKTRLIASELSHIPDLHYSEDPLPRGPAGCLRDLQEWLGEGPFIVLQATGYYDFDLSAMVAEHQRELSAVTLGARKCPDDPDLLEPAGVYVVEPSTLPLIGPVGYQDFKEQFLPKVLAAGMRVRCHTIAGQATLVHSPGHYLSAIREAILREAQQRPQGFIIDGPADMPVVRHETASVHPAARLTGPVWIDEHATIEPGCVLAGPVVIGPGVRVGTGALLHRTVAMHHAAIAPGSEIFSTLLPPKTPRTAPRRMAPAGHMAENWTTASPLARTLARLTRAR